MEDLLKLESDDTSASRDVASKIQSRLKGNRDPLLLGELVDFYFRNYSKRARKVLTTLREAHSQDFFDKLNECIWSQKILPVFKLLAHALNSQQTTWLYRIVDHPLFSSILQQLEESEDVMVLSMGVLVVAAILPLVPTYIASHLQRLFHIFCDLATIRTTKRLGLTPQELVLHLDVSVYYLFLQLYALFPCNLFSFFHTYCENSTRAQVHAFQEFVAPLFHQVQLHPGLVTDSCAYELSKGKWGAMEPSDIATHSIQFCMDSLLNVSHSPPGKGGVVKDETGSPRLLDLPSLPTFPPLSSHRPSSLSLTATPPSTVPRLQLNAPNSLQDDQNTTERKTTAMPPSTVPHPQTYDPSHLQEDSPVDAHKTTTQQDSHSPTTPSPAQNLPGGPLDEITPSCSGSLNPGGLKTSAELSHFWSPSVSLGQIPTPGAGHSESTSHRSSRTSVTHHSQLAGHSTLSSPNSDSAVSSTLHTPAPPLFPPGSGGIGGVFSYNNYSPTASVDGESLFSRQGLTQSAVHTPSRLDESLTSSQLDPMSQSMRVESGGRSHSPTKSLGRERRSIRSKLGRLFGGLFRKEEEEEWEEPAGASEEYIELFLNDSSLHRGRRGVGSSPREQRSSEGHRMVSSDGKMESKPQGSVAVEIEGSRSNHPSDVEGSGNSDSPVNNHRQSGLEGVGQLGCIDIDISTLPPVSNRASRSDSESSQASAHHFQLREDNDSPNTAGAGRFESGHIGHSYQEVGASATCENPPRISSSYPRRSVSSQVSEAGKVRTHTSNSETEVNSRALQLQEKLQRLVEHKEPRGSVEGSLEGSIMESNTPVMETSGQQRAEAMDTGTLHASGHAQGGNTRLTMRRVSVCSRRGIELRFTSESSSGAGGTVTGGSQSDPQEHVLSVQPNGHPSPLALLDQFVSCGEVLHRGTFHSIPLTEQEGVDWNHFGGCPHSEEFRMMQSQVVLLHSQLLFERYQCVQHAKRNRRLLSKARSAAHVTEELVSLRHQVHQRNVLVSSLQQQLRKVTEVQAAKQHQQQGREGGNVTQEAAKLKDSNARLEEELWRMKERNRKLEEELKGSREQFCKLSDEHRQVQPKVQRASQLEAELAVLSKEHLKLKEAWRRQRDHVISLESQSQEGWEWRARCASLQREREGQLKRMHGLEQGMGACRACVKELEEEGARKQRKIDSLHNQLEGEKERAWCKTKSIEEKYGSMKAIGQQLECHLMELKSRTTLQRKKVHVSKHRRNPSSSSAATTPSPAPSS